MANETGNRKLKLGIVGLDGLAGPTETMVIADEQANPAWVAADRASELRLQLGKAVEEGNRGVVAVAQVLRGDLDMKKQDFRSALVDGYLRTIVLFADVREMQPEALFKAAKCFEELRESQNAEKMRKKLLSEFPDSTYSRQINSGS